MSNSHTQLCFDACLHCITCTVDADYDRVELKIPLGDRPCCKEIDQMKADGLEELVVLMKRCWDGSPTERPTFEGKCCYCCIAVHKSDELCRVALHIWSAF